MSCMGAEHPVPTEIFIHDLLYRSSRKSTSRTPRPRMSACTINSKGCFVLEHQEVMLGMRKHTCIHAGALCTLYAQSKTFAGGLYVDHLGVVL